MKYARHKILIIVMIIALGAFSISCASSSSGINVLTRATGIQVGFSSVTKVNPCESDSDSFECVLSDLTGEFPGDFLSLFNILGSFDSFRPLLIMQIPSDASSIEGVFDDGMTNSPLVITEDLKSIRVDGSNFIFAEVGTQIVIAALPEDGPTEGEIEFFIDFEVPPGTPTIPVKALAAAEVIVDETTFYMPIMPCIEGFSDIPSVDILGLVTADLIPPPMQYLEGCEGRVYNIVNIIRPIPTLSEWAMIALACVVGIAGALFLILRRKRIAV